jgi:hypothetical protein
MKMAYRRSRSPKGNLVIHDVIISRVGVYRDGRLEITQQMYNKMVSNFNARVQANHVPAYVNFNHGGPRVGKMIALRTEGDFLFADLEIEHPDVAEKVSDNNLTDISIGYYVDSLELYELSLLDNAFGELHDVIPALTVESSSEISFEREGELVTLARSELDLTATLEDKNMPNEEIEKLTQRIDALTAAVETLKNTAQPAIDLEARAQEIAAEMHKQDKVETEQLARKLRINECVTALISEGHPLKRFPDALRAKFEKIKSEEAIEATLRYELTRCGQAEAKSIYDEDPDSNKARLAREWDENGFEDRYKGIMTKEQYVERYA